MYKTYINFTLFKTYERGEFQITLNIINIELALLKIYKYTFKEG